MNPATIMSMSLGVRLAATTAVAALLLTIVAPRALKSRPRSVLGFCVGYALLELAALTVTPGTSGRRMLEGLADVSLALGIAQLLYFVVLDLVVERGGRLPLNQLLRDIVRVIAYVVAALTGLRASGIEASSILTTGTVLTAVVGLALQETLGNLASGMSIQLDQPFAVGDWLRIDKGDITGRVISANWRSVTIQGDDRLHFVIPNGYLARNPFTNYSRPGGSCRRALYVTVPNDVPPTRVRAAILAACGDCPEVLTDPAPSVVTQAFTELGIQYWLRFFIADFAARDRVHGELHTRVWFHLHREKIDLAVPARRASVQNVDGEARARMAEEVVADRRAAIDAVDFLRPLGDASKDLLARRGHRKLYAKGETVIRRGETGRELFIVRRGAVVIRVDDQDIAHLGAGQFFGERALLTGSARHANVITEEETEVFEIDDRMFQEVLQAQPQIAEDMSRIVAQREAELACRVSGTPPSPETTGKATADLLSKIRSAFGL